MPDASQPDDRRTSLVRKIVGAHLRMKIHDPRVLGEAAAELHDQYGLSWPMIAKMTGVPMSTVYRRARPYVQGGRDGDRST